MSDLNTVLTERGNKYGAFEHHAEVSQSLKGVIYQRFMQRRDAGEDLYWDHYIHEAIDMITHKLGRIANGDAYYDDSWRDIAGYATLVVNKLNTK